MKNPELRSRACITFDNLFQEVHGLFTDSLVLVLGSTTNGKDPHYQQIFPSGAIGLDIDPEQRPDVLTDAMTMGIRDGTLKYVYCNALLEHVPNPQKVIDEIYRILQTGGWAFLYVPFLFPYHASPDDYFRFTASGISYLCRNFSEIRIQPAFYGYAGTALRFVTGFIYPFDRWAANLLAVPLNFLISFVYRSLRFLQGRSVNKDRLNEYLRIENSTGYSVMLHK